MKRKNQPKKNTKKSKKNDEGITKYYIATSGFKVSGEETLQELAEFGHKMDKTIIQDSLSPKTTHLLVHKVNGKVLRTMKVLGAIANGLWIMDVSWLHASIEKGTWEEESKYETKFFPGAILSRKIKAQGKEPLFKGLKFYINQTIAQKSEVQNLLSDSGGEIVRKFSDADICITGKQMQSDSQGKTAVVSEKWLYESLHNYNRQNLSHFPATGDKTNVK